MLKNVPRRPNSRRTTLALGTCKYSLSENGEPLATPVSKRPESFSISTKREGKVAFREMLGELRSRSPLGLAVELRFETMLRQPRNQHCSDRHSARLVHVAEYPHCLGIDECPISTIASFSGTAPDAVEETVATEQMIMRIPAMIENPRARYHMVAG